MWRTFVISDCNQSPTCPIVKVKLWQAEYSALGSRRKAFALALTLPLTHGGHCILVCTLFLPHVAFFFFCSLSSFAHLPFGLAIHPHLWWSSCWCSASSLQHKCPALELLVDLHEQRGHYWCWGLINKAGQASRRLTWPRLHRGRTAPSWAASPGAINGRNSFTSQIQFVSVGNVSPLCLAYMSETK